MRRRELLQTAVAAGAAAVLPFRAEADPAFKPIWLNQYTYSAPERPSAPQSRPAVWKSLSANHIALTIENYETRAVVGELKRLKIIPETSTVGQDGRDLGIYGVDINNFKLQVCAWD
ncbi:MAG: hypothetical protein HY646_03815, partial [Acidobacteria bacterium]|nr:hypothetical protein [Acidobacteriota bacterium]